MNSPISHRYPELSVLLITDGTGGYESLQKFFLSAEVRLLIAEGADRGILMFEEFLPNLVFICCSAGLDPFALTSTLQERWGCRAHTVLVGGENTVAGWKRASEAGALACLPDPEQLEEADAILQRLQKRMTTCSDTSQQLLDLSRTSRLLDTLPFGIMLLGRGEELIFSNRAAQRLTGLSGHGEGRQLEELFLLLYGADRDANLLLARTALHSGATWNDTLFCGQNSLTLRLELQPLTTKSDCPSSFHLLTVQDIGNCPTSQPYQTMLSAAVLDLLFLRRHTPLEQIKLASSMTEGIVPPEEPFSLASLFTEAGQRLSLAATLPEPVIPDFLPATFHGQSTLLKEILMALFTWATDSKGPSMVTSSVALQGRDGTRYCLRFSVTAVDRRLTRSSYQRGDQAVAQQLAQSGLPALKSLRGIGLATTLVSLVGSCLILKTVAHEGKTALFDLWLTQDADHEAALPPTAPQPPVVRSTESVQFWDAAAGIPLTPDRLRVLVAEDNPLEQLNIKGLMERLGHQVLLVGNGREAVEECEQDSFDLILMDILMPVMDGFEAVRLIREHERLQGRHTPIVALTSYSLKAVRERCAKAGMDGYLPKPVTQAKLEELTSSFFAAAAPPAEQTPAPQIQQPTGASLPVLDLREAITNLGSDVSFFREMLTLFTNHGYPLLDELVNHLNSDATVDTLEKTAHKLKGMAANIGANQLSEICMRLQDAPPPVGSARRAVCIQELQTAREQLVTLLEQLDWQAIKEQYSS